MKKYACITVSLAMVSLQYAQAAEVPFVELRGHTGHVLYALFSPDAKKVITSGLDGTVRLWDVETGWELRKLEEHTGKTISVALSPDGKRIVTANVDKIARIRSVDSGEELHKLEAHTDTVLFANFSPDGKKIVTASADKTSRIWDVESGKELQKLEGHTNAVHYATFSTDGKKIATASEDVSARIWDAESGKGLHTLTTGMLLPPEVAIFSPDGKKIVTGYSESVPNDGWTSQVKIWDTVTGSSLYESHDWLGTIYNPSSYLGPVAPNYTPFSPDGKKLITMRLWGDRITVEVRTESGTGLKTLGRGVPYGYYTTGSFSPDGKKVVTVGGRFDPIRIWDTESGIEWQRLEGQRGAALFAEFSPDGKKIVTIGLDTTVRIWTLE